MALDHHTGLVARLYGPLRSFAPDPEPYAVFVGACGEPALELGCGDGGPILELRKRDLDVVLHHQALETMDLGSTYRSI